MVSPPTSAPPVESRPPRIAAGNARSATGAAEASRPGLGKAVRNSPATAASAPATTQDTAVTRPNRMPISEAVSSSSAVARMATPQLEYLKAAKNAPIRMSPITMAATRLSANRTPRIFTVRSRHGSPRLNTLLPIRRVSSVISTMLTPMVTMASEMTEPPQPTNDQALYQQPDQGGHGDAREQRRQKTDPVVQPGDDIGPGQQKCPVGEVHHFGGLEDDDETKRDQGVDESERKPGEQQLQKSGHDGGSGRFGADNGLAPESAGDEVPDSAAAGRTAPAGSTGISPASPR